MEQEAVRKKYLYGSEYHSAIAKTQVRFLLEDLCLMMNFSQPFPA